MTKVSGCLSVYPLRSPGYTDKSKGNKKKVCLRKSKILVNLLSKIWKGCGYEITDKRNCAIRDLSKKVLRQWIYYYLDLAPDYHVL